MSTDQPTEPESETHRRGRLRIKERIRFKLPRPGMAAVRRMAVGAVVLLVLGWAAVWGVNYALRPRPKDPVPPPEPRLIGSWVSDTDANIEDLRKSRSITQREERDLRTRVFRSKVTYTEDVITTEVAGEVHTEAYRVVRQTADEVVVKYWFGASNKEEEVRIRFLGPDRYQLDMPQFGLTEIFRRAPEAVPPDPGRP